MATTNDETANRENRLRLWLGGKITFAQLVGMDALPAEFQASSPPASGGTGGGTGGTTPTPGTGTNPNPTNSPNPNPTTPPGSPTTTTETPSPTTTDTGGAGGGAGTGTGAGTTAATTASANVSANLTPAARAFAALSPNVQTTLAGHRETIELRATMAIEGAARDGRLLPYELQANLDEAVRRLADDALLPQAVAYQVGQEQKVGTRFEAFCATVNARPQHALTAQTIDPNATVLPGDDAPPKEGAQMTEARRKQLLAASSVGKAVLDTERRSGQLRLTSDNTRR